MLAGKYLFAKSFIATSRCNDCGICLQACPVGAIKKFQGRLFWKSSCESCMKCMNNCPKKAIETAHGFVLIILIISWILSTILIKSLLDLPMLEGYQWLQNGYVKLMIFTIIAFPLLFLGYSIMHILFGFRFFEWMVVHTSLSYYRFWGRYNPTKIFAKGK